MYTHKLTLYITVPDRGMARIIGEDNLRESTTNQITDGAKSAAESMVRDAFGYHPQPGEPRKEPALQKKSDRLHSEFVRKWDVWHSIMQNTLLGEFFNEYEEEELWRLLLELPAEEVLHE